MFLMKMSGVLAKIVLARAITPYEYGIITLAIISLPNMFQLFINFCLFDMLSHSNEGKKYFSFSILYTTISTLIVAFVIYIFREPFFNFLNLPLDLCNVLYLAIIIALFPQVIMTDIMGLLRGLKKYDHSIIISSLPSLLRFLFVLIAVYLLDITDFTSIIIIFALPSMFALLFIFASHSKIIIQSVNSISMPSKKMYLFGTSLFIMGLFISLNEVITRMIISHGIGVEWQGYFDVSSTLVSTLAFSFTALTFISIPEATGTENKKEILFKSGGLGDVARALFSFLIFCVIMLYFYSIEFIILLFSDKYVNGADYVIILGIGYIFLFIQQFLSLINISFNKDTKTSISFILVTLFLILCIPFVSYFLIQTMGFLGAYVSITFFLILYTIITIIRSKDLSPLKALFYKIERLFIATIITFFLLYHLELPLVYGVIISAITYTFLIFSLGYLNKKLIFNFFISKE